MVDSSIRARVKEAIAAAADVEPGLRSVVVAEVLRFLLESEPRGGAIERAGGRPAPTNPDLPETLVEALAEIGVRSHQETIAAILAYRLQTGAAGGMTSTELADAYRGSRLARPQNLSDTIAKAMRKGWIVPSEPKSGQKAWRVTALGVRAFGEWRSEP